MNLADLPWLAIVVGAVAAFMLGALWYSPLLFGKKWVPLAYPGKTIETLEGGSNPWLYAVPAIGWLVVAATLGWIAAATGLSGDLLGSLRVGLYAGIGIILPVYAPTYLFGGKPLALYGIDAGYPAAGAVVVGLALGLLG